MANMMQDTPKMWVDEDENGFVDGYSDSLEDQQLVVQEALETIVYPA